MQGADEVKRRRDRLKSVFSLVKSESLSAESNAHFARYLCILVSGYAEQSIKALIAEYVEVRSAPTVRRHVNYQMRTLRNIDTDKLKQLVDSFDPEWWTYISASCSEELDALTSVASTRNSVSHGGDSGITLNTIEGYFNDISRLLAQLARYLDTTKGRADLEVD
jgi:hypothetical protein